MTYLDKRRPYSRRTVYAHIKPALTKYSALIGEVTWASNNLHSLFYTLFQAYFPDLRHNRPMAQAIWHTLRSDDMQRRALRAVISHSSDFTQRQRRNLLWAIDSAKILSEYRNDAVHTAFDVNWNKDYFLEPSDSSQPKRLEKLRRVGHAKLFRLLIGDLNQVGTYASAIFEDETSKGTKVRNRPMPRRPVLRSVLHVARSSRAANSKK